MKNAQALMAALMTLGMLAALPAAHAGYPAEMKVKVEVLNETGQNLSLVYGSWVTRQDELRNYFLSAEQGAAKFRLTLPRPADGGAHFRYAAADGKKCQFKMTHRSVFQWLGLAKNEKTATGKSIGTVPAVCAATVVDGRDSLGRYSVRFSMK